MASVRPYISRGCRTLALQARWIARPAEGIQLSSVQRLLSTASTEAPTTKVTESGEKPDNCLRVLIVGAPGAGKGTQSHRIRSEFPVYPISSGDVLRRHIAMKTVIGQRAAPIVAKGEMVPDNIMVDLIDNELDQLDHEHWLLDGFPRSVAQAELLQKSLTAKEQPLNTVLNLVVPEEVLLQRIEDRWVHVPSGRVYNLSYNPPKTPGKDDVTGEPLTKREDDKPEVLKARLQRYNELTAPMLEYYDAKQLLHTFRGSTSDEIYPQIRQFLSERFNQK
ncbi:Adenylate kinase 2 [Dimargaris xerosporica]|nr:Adenylate kinase 2 [Dimargaris xerosporica]